MGNDWGGNLMSHGQVTEEEEAPLFSTKGTIRRYRQSTDPLPEDVEAGYGDEGFFSGEDWSRRHQGEGLRDEYEAYKDMAAERHEDFMSFEDWETLRARYYAQEEAGLGGHRLYDKARELRDIKLGRAGPSVAQEKFEEQVFKAGQGLRRRSAGYRGAGGAAAARYTGRQTDVINKQASERVRQMQEMERSGAAEQLEQLLIGAEAGGAQALAAQANMAHQAKLAQASATQGFWAALLSGAATLGAAWIMGPAGAVTSDERVKTNKDPQAGASAAYEFLETLQGGKYDMPMTNERGQYGVMAQSAERSDMGRTMVRESPTGIKMIDNQKALSNMLLAQKSLHDRLKMLEGIKGGK